VDGWRYPWGWQNPEYDDSAWAAAIAVEQASGFNAQQSGRWMLVPRPIPLMEEKPDRMGAVRKSIGPRFSAGMVIPPNATAVYLLDQGHLTAGYPELVVSGGRGASILLRYTEALREKDGRSKGNRNEIEGKTFVGFHDQFIPDGGTQRLYRPLWWRAWRYIELAIETANEPLTIEDLRSTSVAPGSKRTTRAWRVSRKPAGAPPASAPTKLTWTAPITSSSSTSATRASRRSFRSTTSGMRA
jgi:hypothetical protein